MLAPQAITTLQCYEQVIQLLKSQQLQPTNNIFKQLHTLLSEKDRSIAAMEVQITKYKAEQMKNAKLISQLQEKLTQICPNSNNTGSAFMMASQFKDFFDDFMKNCLPACLSPLLGHPQAYAQYCRTLFHSIYSSVEHKIIHTLTQICRQLHLQCSGGNMAVIRSSLLKTIQQNWQNILAIGQIAANLPTYSNPQLQQITSSEQFAQMKQKLLKICAYMVLQQRKWQFACPIRMDKFVKKQCTCIDGWIREREDVVVVLEGLCREGEEGTRTYHPNLKNYVIPYQREEDEKFQFKQIVIVNKTDDDCRIRPAAQTIIKVDRQCQYSPSKMASNFAIPIKQDIEPKPVSSPFVKQPSRDMSCSTLRLVRKNSNNKQNLNSNLQKMFTNQHISKLVSKPHEPQPETDSLSIILSPHPGGNVRQPKSQHHSSNNTLKSAQHIENMSEHITAVPGVPKPTKLKNNKNVHNLISDPSFEEIISLPQRKKDYDQLPLKRETSRSKKSNSRKASAGKIVGQALEAKENGHRNNRDLRENKENMNKEVVYKEMIKQKLVGEHHQHKTEREKHKNREEDRPLRMMHFKKIKEKYLNL